MNGDRSPARATGPRGFFRYFRRDRPTGRIAAGPAGVHANGPAGQIGGKAGGRTAVAPRTRGHQIKIIQDGAFPQGFRGAVTGAGDPGRTSSIWDKIEYEGRVRRAGDGHVAAPGSGPFSSTLWGCT